MAIAAWKRLEQSPACQRRKLALKRLVGMLESLPALAVQPRQLLVEFHHRVPGIGPAKTVEAVTALRCSGYRLFAIAETGRELSFIYDGNRGTEACRQA